MMIFQSYSDDTQKPKKRKARPSSSGLLIFIATFAVSLVLFALIGMALWFNSNATPSDDPASDPVTFPTTAPTDSLTLSGYDDRFSVAVYITDDLGELQTVSLVTVTPEDRDTKIEVIGLPRELALSDTQKNDTLYRRYDLNKMDSCQNALQAYFGKPVDYYVVFAYDQIASYLTDLNGTFTYTLKTDISEQADDGSYSISLSAGTQSLKPAQVANLFRYNSWAGGKRERADMHANLIASFLEQFLTPSRNLPNDHAILRRNASETNLSGEAFGLIQPVLKELAGSNADPLCTPLTVSGEFDGAGDLLRFTLSNDTLTTIRSNLR